MADAGQLFQIGLDQRVGIHVDVHGRRNHNRSGGGQQNGGEQIVGQAAGEFGQQVGRGRGKQDQVGRIGQADVADFGLLGQVKGLG